MSLSIKIAITPKASGQSSYEILDLIVVSGRAYLSLKDENTSAVTDKVAWTQITENTYDIAVRLGYVGTETEWLASLSAASEEAAVIALQAASDANDATTAANAATVLAQNAAASANTAAANITSTVPWSLYRSRVLADSGVISDLEKLTKLYIENLKLLDNTVFLWDGSAGMKTRTSGVNQYATKLYDMSSGNKDAVQATEVNQPFVGGGIAPSEKRRVTSLQDNKVLSHTTITIDSTGTNGFAITTVLKPTFENVGASPNKGLYLNGMFINITTTSIGIFNATTGSILWALALNNTIGKNKIITITANSSGIFCYVDGVLIPITSGSYTPFSSSLSGLFNNSANDTFAGSIYHHQIFNKALSASEVQAQHAYLRLQYAEIEGINIGNQHWATSNYEGVVTGNGTVIPEVQDGAAWAALTTPAWCYYNNDPLNGAVYGKLYNWYAVQAIAANPPAGWRVPTQADFTQLANYLGGTAVAGGKLKKEGLAYWSSPNTGATNESGFSAIGAGYRTIAGEFADLSYSSRMWSSASNRLGIGYNSLVITIDSVASGFGYNIRLIRNEPVGASERTIETGYITNALGATNLDIIIPFGYQVESIRFDSETNITGLSAKLLTGALVELETLFTAKSVTANIQKVIAADADQSIQQTDAVVRINGTKANTASRFRVWVKLTKVVFS